MLLRVDGLVPFIRYPFEQKEPSIKLKGVCFRELTYSCLLNIQYTHFHSSEIFRFSLQ
jgi:hypothetical protein